MKNYKRLAAAALLCAALTGLSSCGGTAAGRSEPEQTDSSAESVQSTGVAVETMTVRTDSVSSDSTVSGMVTADGAATVSVALTAKVLDTFVSAGDTVEEGQPLCRLELDSTLSNYRAAALSLRAAQQSYQDQSEVFDQQIAAINQQIILAQKQVPLAQMQTTVAEEQIPLAEQQIPQLEQQIETMEQQIALLEQQSAMAEKQLNDLKALFAIGAASQAEIDAAELQLSQVQLQVSQAKIQVDQAKMQIDQAQMQIDQAQLQVAQSALQPDQARLQVSQAQLQLSSAIAQKNSTLSQLQASIESARSNVQQLESVLKNIDGEGNIVAPMSGVLTSFNAEKDNFVSSAMPVAIINETGKMEITVGVPESLIPKLQVGDVADVTVTAMDLQFEAAIHSMDQTANSMTRLYNVVLTVPEEVQGLLAGMFADVTFHTDTIEETVVIPSQAILNREDTQYVYVVAADGTARFTEITTGMTSGGVTVVTGGLRGGERLVTVGQSYLKNGDTVRIVGGD